MSRGTETTDRYLFLQNAAELQRQACVERDIAELVIAHARLCVDSRKPVQFYGNADSPIQWDFALQKLLDRDPDIDPRTQQFFVAYNRAMHTRRLPTIYNKEHLAARLDVTTKQLNWLAYSADRYRTFYIPKANGEARAWMSLWKSSRRCSAGFFATFWTSCPCLETFRASAGIVRFLPTPAGTCSVKSWFGLT